MSDASSEGAWLFTRGGASVRISRSADTDGTFVLVVHGPGVQLTRYRCIDVGACISVQGDIERKLVEDGYSLDSYTSDRRGADPVPHEGEERRRAPLYLVEQKRRD